MSSVGTVASYDALGFDPAPGNLAQVSAVAQSYRELVLSGRANAAPLAIALSRFETELGDLKHRARLLELDARRAQDEKRLVDTGPAARLLESHRRATAVLGQVVRLSG